ncbi:MAG: DegT/DnrJ/EryC1/StrS family aminotransferase [Candidatus Marinamargulisbacteria bacterium]
MNKIINKFINGITILVTIVKPFMKKQTFHFIQTPTFLNSESFNKMKSLVGKVDDNLRDGFENEFAKLIGNGGVISFASARMAFYSFLSAINIGAEDEVIITGFTCSVMVNAIIRTGATPVFVDIDTDTFGTSINKLNQVISKRTKVIVLQHTFGIPIEFDSLKKIAAKKNIFLIEDCALTLSSEHNKTVVGNNGDGAIFSIDHSKPINTLIGGFFYSNNKELLNKVRQIHENSSELSENHQAAIFKQYKREWKYSTAKDYSKLVALNTIQNLYSRFCNKVRPFLEDDFSSMVIEPKNYPYPAKFPSFLTIPGMIWVRRWEEEKKKRLECLNAYKALFEKFDKLYVLPEAYFDKSKLIIPLRFVFTCNNAEIIKRELLKYLDINQFWFTRPIVCCPDPLSKMGYIAGTCGIAEETGERIINLPITFVGNEQAYFFKVIEKIIPMID